MTAHNNTILPIVKWCGGKRSLLPAIIPLIPDDIEVYCEPFAGGLAVCLALQPKRAIINDYNAELMNVYRTTKNNLAALITSLKKHKNEAEYFYALRDKDRNKASYAKMSSINKASRILYLNKTCYNGLFRVNRNGEYNAPYGRYKNPAIVNEQGLSAVSAYLNSADIQMLTGDYSQVLERLTPADFVYLDPPYDADTNSESFTGYTAGGFNHDAQIALREFCDKLNERGIRFLLSNSATNFIKKQYGAYHIEIVRAKRAINCLGTGRGAVEEVLVRNY